MQKRLYWLGSVCLLGCSGPAAVPGQAQAPVALAERPQKEASSEAGAPRERPRVSASPLLAYQDETESDRVFVANAERAIGEYREFLARAGDGEQYALAVKRSREQIEDLQAEIEFVRAGMQQRATH